MKRIDRLFLVFIVLAITTGCKSNGKSIDSEQKQEQMLDSVQYYTFQYFWDGAEQNSGLARERYHIDDVYPLNDKGVVTSGGGGFGLMNLIVAMERNFISREEGLTRLDRIITFLEKADKFHGAYPHWWSGETGKVKPFSKYDDGGDLVETAFMIQGLLTIHQYLDCEDNREQALATRIDKLWRAVEWDWYTKEGTENALYWHWSPNYNWKMNFPVKGYNECLIMYVLAAASPTHPVSEEVYHEGWADSGAIVKPHKEEGIPLLLRYQSEKAGPLFWAHYSFLGLDPRGLKDRYATYFEEMKNYTLVNRAYCIRNPKNYKGYGAKSWGLTASYSVNGYSAHSPIENRDFGVISPTAALSSIVYTPQESLEVIKYLYDNRSLFWNKYGFIDAYSVTADWYANSYLAIDQGPITVMIENYRTGLLWNLFMSHPDVQRGLKRLDFSSPHIE